MSKSVIQRISIQSSRMGSSRPIHSIHSTSGNSALGRTSLKMMRPAWGENAMLSTAAVPDVTHIEPKDHWRSLTLALDYVTFPLSQPFAREMEMDEASETKDEYDKVLLLMNQGHAGFDKKGNYGLSRQGVGTALDLSRKTATFCMQETQLLPNLVLVAPTKPAMYTALLAFSHCSPQAATRRPVRWICQSDIVDHAEEDQLPTAPQVEAICTGLDLSGYHQPDHVVMDSLSVEAKVELLHQSENVLTFLQSREEKVIAMSSQSTWLQAFCGFALTYEPRTASMEGFRSAEMRAVGIRFGKQ